MQPLVSNEILRSNGRTKDNQKGCNKKTVRADEEEIAAARTKHYEEEEDAVQGTAEERRGNEERKKRGSKQERKKIKKKRTQGRENQHGFPSLLQSRYGDLATPSAVSFPPSSIAASTVDAAAVARPQRRTQQEVIFIKLLGKKKNQGL